MRLGTSRIPGLVVTEHEVSVPLDHAVPGGEQIRVYARELVAARKRDRALPWLLYLASGPGVRAPRPTGTGGWLGRALADHRVLLLDQRGTGRSTPQTRRSLARLSPPAQAQRLAHFRADSIVRDAEVLRRELLGDGTWSLLGQSYGGFVATTYLSLAPESLAQVLVTGGLPPLDRTPEEVYRATFGRVHQQWQRLVERYPDDSDRLDRVADHLAGHDVHLPSGDLLTVPRLQSTGMVLGHSDGLEAMHYLLESAWDGDELSDEFLTSVEASTSFVRRPLHAVLHESIYCAGTASRWAAQRVRNDLPHLSPDVRPLQPTGEMVFPWMFEVDSALRPLREAAERLAAYDGWPALYDTAGLAANTVPVAAAIYHDDMYVESSFSLETARRIGNVRPWVTKEFSHDGLRSDARVIDRLFELAAQTVSVG